ncbi:MAG: hypothetical protein AB1Z57_02690 [Acidimicrobiia bacterium]
MRFAAVLGVVAVLAIAGTVALQSAPAPVLPDPVVLSARPPADLGGDFEVVPPVVDLDPSGDVDDDEPEAPSDAREGSVAPGERTERFEPPDDVDDPSEDDSPDFSDDDSSGSDSPDVSDDGDDPSDDADDEDDDDGEDDDDD